jgi:transposase
MAQQGRDGVEALSRLKDQMEQHDARAAQVQSELQSALDKSQAHIKDLQKRLFGRKSEKPGSGNEQQTGQADVKKRARGQQPGKPGHGRTFAVNLPARVEEIDVPEVDQCCPECGLALTPHPGVVDSEVIEIEVKAYRRILRRKQYQSGCLCCVLPAIVTAPRVPKIIPKGKYGVSIWTELIVDKFLYGRPTHRLLQSWKGLGLNVSAGTVAGGFAYLAPMFAPVMQAFLDRQHLDSHWHADETGWKVFERVDGKKTNRWYLWVYRSNSTIYFDLEPSRAAAVPEAHFKGLSEGIVICDRYSAYKKMARTLGFLLAFCWAHVRRDFLTLAQGYPQLETWSLAWVERIGTLYHLNHLRLAVQSDAVAFARDTASVELHLQSMSTSCDLALQDTQLHEAAGKVMASLRHHWPGLTIFMAHPEIALDNNRAENAVRGPVVGRKNYYGSGSIWSAQFTASMFTVLLTLDQVWGINARLWMTEFLQACAIGRGAPPDLSLFLPWAMTPQRLAHFEGRPPGTIDAGTALPDTS